MRGLSVFTRPSSISGNPVRSSIGRASTPSAASSRAVPPVDTISTPSSASPRAKSTSPRLSETVSSARRTRMAPGATGSTPLSAVPDIGVLANAHPTRVVGIDGDRAGRDQPDGPGKQAVLDRVHRRLDVAHPGIVGQLKRLLQDDRPGVHALVDEVHGHAGDPHAVLDGLLDGTDPREGGQ